MSKGWIKLHRSMFDNDLWTAEPFTKGQAWIDLIGHANHRPASIWIRGIEVSIDRGQLAWSELTMSDRWKWSRGKVRRYLGMLRDRGMVVQQTNKLTTILTICKYEAYQAEQTTDETTDGTSGRTTDGQQTDNRRYTNKNVKTGENDENKNIKPGPQQAESEPAIGFIPTNKYNTEGEQYPVTQSQIDDWQAVYPAVNVLQEVKKAKAWLQANPAKAKTYRGMARFLNGWLSRQQDQGGGNAQGQRFSGGGQPAVSYDPEDTSWADGFDPEAGAFDDLCGSAGDQQVIPAATRDFSEVAGNMGQPGRAERSEKAVGANYYPAKDNRSENY